MAAKAPKGRLLDRLDIQVLNQLQLFLLALVELGLITPYDMLSKAGLGSGLTSPALKRLEKEGFLTSKPGPRRRVEYAITKEGKKVLRDNLEAGPEPFWEQGQYDVFDALPRSIILAWLHSGTDEASDRIGDAWYRLTVRTRKKLREAEELRASMLHLQDEIVKEDRPAAKALLVATAYRWIKAESEAAQFAFQENAVQEIRKLLKWLPPAPELRNRP